MANPATSTVGKSIDRGEMNVQAIGFPPVDDFEAAEGSLITELPVLARVPRLEPLVAIEAETKCPAQVEARRYRVDSTLPPPAPVHPPVVPFLHQPENTLQVEMEQEETAQKEAVKLPVEIETSPSATSPPLQTLRQLDHSSSEERISASLLRLQVMLKPLARIILLAALLTASALAYLLLENNGVPQAPSNQEVLPILNRLSEPRLTRKPESSGSSDKSRMGSILKPSRPLSAIGPGSKHIVANNVAARTVTPMSRESLQQAPAANTHNLPARHGNTYPNTGHPNVTLMPAARAPIATQTQALNKKTEQPVAVARLTGSIQSPIKK